MASVLLVDDDKDTCRPLARLLEYMGHEVQHATSGREALGWLNKMRPNLVLLDVSMPEMDGLQVLKEMRKNPDLEETPVLMYTALSDAQRRKQALELGARDYLVKGLTGLGELQSRISQHLLQ